MINPEYGLPTQNMGYQPRIWIYDQLKISVTNPEYGFMPTQNMGYQPRIWFTNQKYDLLTLNMDL